MGFLEFLFWMFIGKLIMDFIRHTGNAKKELQEEIKESIAAKTHIVNVEQHADVYYWFDHESGEFLAQGRTMEEIVDVVKSRFPEHFFFFNGDLLLHGPDWTFRKLES